MESSFTVKLSDKFAIKVIVKIPPHLKCVATLPCEICLQEVVMFKNCMNNYHACKIQPLKIVVEKYSSNDVSIK